MILLSRIHEQYYRGVGFLPGGRVKLGSCTHGSAVELHNPLPTQHTPLPTQHTHKKHPLVVLGRQTVAPVAAVVCVMEWVTDTEELLRLLWARGRASK